MLYSREATPLQQAPGVRQKRNSVYAAAASRTEDALQVTGHSTSAPDSYQRGGAHRRRAASNLRYPTRQPAESSFRVSNEDISYRAMRMQDAQTRVQSGKSRQAYTRSGLNAGPLAAMLDGKVTGPPRPGARVLFENQLLRHTNPRSSLGNAISSKTAGANSYYLISTPKVAPNPLKRINVTQNNLLEESGIAAYQREEEYELLQAALRNSKGTVSHSNIMRQSYSQLNSSSGAQHRASKDRISKFGAESGEGTRASENNMGERQRKGKLPRQTYSGKLRPSHSGAFSKGGLSAGKGERLQSNFTMAHMGSDSRNELTAPGVHTTGPDSAGRQALEQYRAGGANRDVISALTSNVQELPSVASDVHLGGGYGHVVTSAVRRNEGQGPAIWVSGQPSHQQIGRRTRPITAKQDRTSQRAFTAGEQRPSQQRRAVRSGVGFVVEPQSSQASVDYQSQAMTAARGQGAQYGADSSAAGANFLAKSRVSLSGYSHQSGGDLHQSVSAAGLPQGSAANGGDMPGVIYVRTHDPRTPGLSNLQVSNAGGMPNISAVLMDPVSELEADLELNDRIESAGGRHTAASKTHLVRKNRAVQGGSLARAKTSKGRPGFGSRFHGDNVGAEITKKYRPPTGATLGVKRGSAQRIDDPTAIHTDVESNLSRPILNSLSTKHQTGRLQFRPNSQSVKGGLSQAATAATRFVSGSGSTAGGVTAAGRGHLKSAKSGVDEKAMTRGALTKSLAAGSVESAKGRSRERVSVEAMSKKMSNSPSARPKPSDSPVIPTNYRRGLIVSQQMSQRSIKATLITSAKKGVRTVEAARQSVADARAAQTADNSPSVKLTSIATSIDAETTIEMEEFGKQSKLVEKQNATVTEYLQYFNQHQLENDPVFNPEVTRRSRVDCTSQLAQAKRRIKIIQYNCNNTVAAESEKILALRVPPVQDGPKRGSEKQIDIIEGCPLICKVDVQGHKAPLRIHVQYETKDDVRKPKQQNVNNSYLNSSDAFSQEAINANAASSKGMAKTSSTGFFSKQKKRGSIQGALQVRTRPDLQVYVSDVNKEPNEHTALQQFIDPGTRFTIKLPEASIDDKHRAPKIMSSEARLMRECFLCKSIYLSFNSSKSCTLTVSVSFPEQPLSKAQADLEARIAAQRAEDEGLSPPRKVFITQKDIKAKFQQQVLQEMHEVAGNEAERKKRAAELKKKALKRQREGLKPCDTNFIEKNQMESREVHQQRMRVQFMNSLREQRNEVAIMRREEQREERVDKINFDMTKWDLYRIRVDLIDEKWHEFKKRQMKILWWNCIIMRHFACKKAKYNFDEFLRIRIQTLREQLLIFKIGYYFQQYMKKKGPTKEERIRQTFRQQMNFLHFSMEDRAVRGSKVVLYKFCKEVNDQNNIYTAFLKAHKRVCVPLVRFRELEGGYEVRKQALDAQFMRERTRMSKYYQDKMKKKGSKLKANFKALETLPLRFKEILLDAYQNRYLYNINLRAAIHFTAMRQVRAYMKKQAIVRDQTDNENYQNLDTTREWPESPELPYLYTQDEYRNLVLIERNIKNVTAFLFKGVKEPATLIGEDGLKPELYDAFVGAKTIKKNDSREYGDDEGEERKGSVERGAEEGDAGAEEVASPSPVREASPSPEPRGDTELKNKSPAKTSSTKTNAAKSSPAKSKGKSGSPSKKGAKGKKKKSVDDVNVPREVNMDVVMPRYNNVMPTRKIMQMLVLRASTMKEKDVEEPLFEYTEVLPWRKTTNEDILL